MNEPIKLKIDIWPGLSNKCEIEFHDDQVLVLKSSLPEWDDPGEAFHAQLNEKETVKKFENWIIDIIEKPTEKKVITIQDGLQIKIELRNESKTIKHTLSSIQDNSKETKFVKELLDFTSELIDNEKLTKYLNNVKHNYLR